VASTVLITGANGFAGAYLGPELSNAGFTVVGTTSSLDTGRPNGYDEVFHVDITDLTQIVEVVRATNPHYIVNLAGISHSVNGAAEAYFEVNFLGARNVLEAVSQEPSKVASILLVSSATVYGRRARSEPSRESDVPLPMGCYALSKFAMEQLLYTYGRTLPIIVARPFNFTGVGQSKHFLVPKIINILSEDIKKIKLGNLGSSRNFTDVRVVVDAFKRLLLCEKAHGQVYNICSSREYRVSELVALVEKLARVRIEVEVVNALRRAADIDSLHGSPEKLISSIGELKKISFEETLQWMISATGYRI
jgi:nucleoside-diphosphate-sugar epimerase